jgi:hypothetical protein
VMFLIVIRITTASITSGIPNEVSIFSSDPMGYGTRKRELIKSWLTE